MPWVERLPSGRWRGGYVDQHGRKRQQGGFRIRAHAKTWAEEGEQAALRGDEYVAKASRTLFQEFAQRWHTARIVEQSTADREQHRYQAILDRWGDTPIGQIGSLELQGWIKELNQTRAAGTVRKYHNLMSAILTAATMPPHRLILENPARHVTLPTASPGREVYLTPEQVDALDGELVSPWDTLMWLLTYTGIRWGEAAGLHVNRIDWLHRRIQVVEVLGQASGGFHLKAYPKGKTRRWVPLPDHLVERLSEHVKQFPPVDCGLHPNCPGLVFSVRPRGREPRPVLRQTFSRWVFHPAANRSKLPADLRIHDLRHTYASWLVQRGVPLREVQYLLGHKSITTTERYAHFAPDAGEAARTVLDRSNIVGKLVGTARQTVPTTPNRSATSERGKPL